MLVPGEQVVYHGVWYKGHVQVNLIGYWRKGQAEPLWVITDLEPERGLRIYLKRMKIDEAFRDQKNLLGMDRVMNKRQDRMEKVLALLLIVYAIAFLIGEVLRDYLYGGLLEAQASTAAGQGGVVTGASHGKKSKKWRRYSGLFVLLKQKWSLPAKEWKALLDKALATFSAIVLPAVPTLV